MSCGRVAKQTVYNWKNDFCANGFRISESLVGKSVQEWILDNPVMNNQAKAWLRSKVGHQPKKAEAHFVIRDFQIYLDQTLLKDWKVPKWKGAKAAAMNMIEDSEFLQVSESCVLAWAHRLGLCYARRRKHYYVDGHNCPDVLAHRKKWLRSPPVPLGAGSSGKGARAGRARHGRERFQSATGKR